MQRIILFLLGFLAIHSTSLSAQSSDLDQAITNLLEKANVPGISIAIIDYGTLTCNKTFGYKSVDTHSRVTENTVFDAASLSKPMFAYAVMQLVEERRFDLDRPLADYMVYEDLEYDERYRQVTARMVLSHTSGLPNWRRGKLEFQSDPGKKFSYSGEGFVWLQKTVAHITGQDMETMMQARVIQPLGMKNTSYVWQEDFEKDFAIPHNGMGKSQNKRRNDTPNAAYSLQTTASDYARFVLAMMKGNQLRELTTNKMLTKIAQVPDKERDNVLRTDIGWGLGWGLQQTRLGQAFWHWGDNGSFKAFVMAYPRQERAMVYFTNSSNGLSFVEELSKEVFGVPCPACTWIDYTKYDQPSFGLFQKIIEQGLDSAMAPLMASHGKHQNTALLPEWQMNNLGYRLLGAKYFDEAKRVFKMNMRAFPKSANAHDSYAEACLRSGQTKLAIDYYRKAYEMDSGNQIAKSIVEQLTGKVGGNTIFVLSGYSNARHVSLAGEFNDWNELSLPLQWRDGAWTCPVQLEPGTYQYKFIVDGVWIADPENVKVSDDKRHNSIVEVK